MLETLTDMSTAFGLFARALPLGDEFRALRESCEGIELADSITGDAHKSLNVVSLDPLSILLTVTKPIRMLLLTQSLFSSSPTTAASSYPHLILS